MPLASLSDWILGFSVHLLTEWNLLVSVYLRCEHRSAKGARHGQLVDSQWKYSWQLAVISVSLFN